MKLIGHMQCPCIIPYLVICASMKIRIKTRRAGIAARNIAQMGISFFSPIGLTSHPLLSASVGSNPSGTLSVCNQCGGAHFYFFCQIAGNCWDRNFTAPNGKSVDYGDTLSLLNHSPDGHMCGNVSSLRHYKLELTEHGNLCDMSI